MQLSDLRILLKKDLLLLWRDRTFFLILLLWLAPLPGLFLGNAQRKDPISEFLKQPAVQNSHTLPDRSFISRGSETREQEESAKPREELPSVQVGIIEGDAIGVGDWRFHFHTMSRDEGMKALQDRSVDILVELPNKHGSVGASIIRSPHIQVVYDNTNPRSKVASEMLTVRMKSLQAQERRNRMALITDSNEQWVVSGITYRTLSARDRAKPESRTGSRIGGVLVLAGALVSSLVMLIIVEENTRHTLPMVLVCAVDRRVVFASKLLFCMVPALGAVLTMVVRTWNALPVKPPDLGTRVAILGTAFGDGLLFVFILSLLLVASGGRARNNIEALVKVGGPLLICGSLVALTFTPLSSYTPGLILFPITNLVMCISQLLPQSPNWSMCFVAMASSGLFALLLARNGALSMGTEQGLAGDVEISDPKLDSLFAFLIAASAAVLLYNFVGLPASIVYPSVGSLACSAILMVVGIGVLRFARKSLTDSPTAATSRNRILFSSLCALLMAGLTSMAFSAASPVGSVSSEMSRIESVTRLSAAPLWLFSCAMLRALIEEVTLRGVMVKLLVPHFSPFVIIALMSAVGAGLHPLADTWFLMAILSAVLTFIRLYSRSTIPCIILHMAHTAFLWLIWNRVVQ